MHHDDAIKSGQDNARFTCSRNMCALCILGVIVAFYQKLLKFWQKRPVWDDSYRTRRIKRIYYKK